MTAVYAANRTRLPPACTGLPDTKQRFSNSRPHCWSIKRISFCSAWGHPSRPGSSFNGQSGASPSASRGSGSAPFFLAGVLRRRPAASSDARRRSSSACRNGGSGNPLPWCPESRSCTGRECLSRHCIGSSVKADCSTAAGHDGACRHYCHVISHQRTIWSAHRASQQYNSCVGDQTHLLPCLVGD